MAGNRHFDIRIFCYKANYFAQFCFGVVGQFRTVELKKYVIQSHLLPFFNWGEEDIPYNRLSNIIIYFKALILKQISLSVDIQNDVAVFIQNRKVFPSDRI